MSNDIVANIGFHQQGDYLATQAAESLAFTEQTKFTYTFENFFHPLVGDLIEKLNKESLSGMLDPTFLEAKTNRLNNPPLADTFFKYFGEYTKPENAGLTAVEGQPMEIDLSGSGSYSCYNWELLFHIPFTIAVHLSKNQRFTEAQRWFHYIFDPTCNDTSVPAPQRFWKFLGFRQQQDVKQIDELLALLSKPDDKCDSAERKLKLVMLNGYREIKDKPFRPYAVARNRPLAYQYSVVMKYLDNLIAWGDSLFRQDTIESINEATQRYVLAANLLGERPQRIPRPENSRPRTFAEFKRQGLDAMGNALVDLEAKFPLNQGLTKNSSSESDLSGPLFGIGRTLYFCIPRNEKMLGYWDTVADRLFKIRHCMNIEGVVRQLALFDPPIDPGMLVKAAAAGIDIGSVVNGLNQPVGPVRSLLLIQKALELSGEVRGLGAALLSAIEKGDSERLALLRQGHEIKIQQMQQETRFLQWKQAQEATESLLRSRAVVYERYRYYLRLLDQKPDSNTVPDTLPTDRRKLTEENFDGIYAALVAQYEKTITEQDYPRLTLAGDSSPANQSGAEGQGNFYLNTSEDDELNSHLPTARDTRLAANIADTLASVLVFIPDLKAHLHFWGLGASSKVFGGSTVSEASKITAQIFRTIAAWEESQAGIASRTASYERRADEWRFQANLAACELVQIGRQIIGSLIAEQVTHHEYLNVQQQIINSQEVDQFLREKFTNEQIYAWMQGEISRLYYEYYRFAFDTARKAEQTMKRELMRPEVDSIDYIKFNYWDAGRKGLLSGEALYLDLKRMEMAYHENNKREYELTKHISLRQLDPTALLNLKATGSCQIVVPEWLFDLDCPGHYLRRLKTVSLSIPSVTGPYTSLNCTLSLLKSTLRKSPLWKEDDYNRQSPDDHFIDYYGAIQSIVTSNGNNDSGLFETNLRDERFLPFEGAGAESSWKIELPKYFRQFDYDTISDVILHFRYTARQGGDQLKDKALTAINQLITKANESGLALLLSLNHDFSPEWHKLLGGADFKATVTKDYFPYFTQGKTITLANPQIHAIKNGKLTTTTLSDVNLAFNAQGSFELSLEHARVNPDKDAETFVLIGYGIS